MKIKIKILKNGKLPEKKTSGAACYDCYSAQNKTIKPNETVIIPLGFCIEVPEGYYLEIRGRSGLSSKGIISAIGTVDSDYRGEVGAIITNLNNYSVSVFTGERICQCMIKKVIDTEFEPVDTLSSTDRGDNGFGSTGMV